MLAGGLFTLLPRTYTFVRGRLTALKRPKTSPAAYTLYWVGQKTKPHTFVHILPNSIVI